MFSKLKKMALPLTRGYSSILSNKITLYAVFILAIATIYSFMWKRNAEALAVFVLTGIVALAFTKNMVIIMGVAVIISNLAVHAKHIPIHFSEGFDAPSAEEGGDTTKDGDKTKEDKDKAKESGDSAKDGKPAEGAPDTEKLGEMKKQYEELMSLQKQIVDGVKGVYEPLQKAEGIVDGMKESMRSR